MKLPAEHQRDIEVEAGALERHAVAVIDVAHGRTQNARRIEHAARVPDGQHLARRFVAQLLQLQDFAHGLRDRQVARRQQHHEAVARRLIHHHFAKGADVVESGVGARVGQKDQPRVKFDGYTVGHGFFASP
jgi:hypothetical protein